MERLHKVDKWIGCVALITSFAFNWTLPLEQAGTGSIEYQWLTFFVISLFIAVLLFILAWIVVWRCIPAIWEPTWYPKRHW